MTEKKRIDHESEEYRAWKDRSVSPEQSQAEPLELEPIKEEIEEKVEEKGPEQLSESEINKSYFDRVFRVKNYNDRMKKTYYLIVSLVYYSCCFLITYDIYERPDIDTISVISLMLLTIFFAIALPIILIIMGFTVSGGIFIGIFVGLLSWFFGVIGRFIYKILGFDIEIISPELVGKTGEISKRNILGNYSSYPFTATIENTGIYEDNLFYRNNFSVRSNEELKVGMKVEVMEHDKWSLLSFVKNHPTFFVQPLQGQIVIEEKKEDINNA